MPTRDPAQALDRDLLRAEVAAAVGGAPGRRGIGVEVELLPITDWAARPRRVPLHGSGGLIHRLGATAARRRLGSDGPAGEAGWWCHGGRARLSFEPGGQLEVSSAYRPTVAAGLRAASRTTAEVAAALAEDGILLAAVGLDPWRAGTVPQQLHRARYPAMASYLDTRGRAGRTMMRDTCALQINLDLDTGAEAEARWCTANLLAPVATASFACSPGRGGVRSSRSLAWQRVDPTRTGFPPGLREGRGAAADQLERAALQADVLLVADGPRATPGRAGWTFRHWLDEGHPVHGRPTVADLRVHLTTLFHEVRPRGHLELRYVDTVPARWRAAVVTLLAGAVYDARARGRILEVLEPHRRRLPDLLRAAATTGVADPALCALAVEVWSFALAGAGRLPADTLPAGALRSAESYLDRFTVRGRCPGDELADLLRTDPVAAVGWAAEPTPMASPVEVPS